jgi:hypothetical protein
MRNIGIIGHPPAFTGLLAASIIACNRPNVVLVVDDGKSESEALAASLDAYRLQMHKALEAPDLSFLREPKRKRNLLTLQPKHSKKA